MDLTKRLNFIQKAIAQYSFKLQQRQRIALNKDQPEIAKNLEECQQAFNWIKNLEPHLNIVTHAAAALEAYSNEESKYCSNDEIVATNTAYEEEIRTAIDYIHGE